jgi:hypothetical protein
MADFSGGIAQEVQSFSGSVTVSSGFLGGLLGQAQNFSGDLAVPSTLSGGVSNSEQALNGILEGAEFSGGLANLAYSFSGVGEIFYYFSGGFTQLPQRFNETRVPPTLSLVPRNAFGYVDGSYSYVILANKEALIVTDPWWLEQGMEISEDWIGGSEETTVTVPSPPSGGGVYALVNGEWVDITDSLINPPS